MCGVLANKSFRFFFHMFKASLFCTLSHRERFWGGFKSCHISHFFSYKNTCVSCLLVCVCVCVCVVCLWNRVSCVVCSVFVGVLVWTPSKFLIFPRARNDGLTVLRNLTLTVSHILLKSRITLSRCARPQPEVSTKFFQPLEKNSLETAANAERANRTQLLLLIFLFPSLISQAIFAVGLCSCVSFSRRTRKLSREIYDPALASRGPSVSFAKKKTRKHWTPMQGGLKTKKYSHQSAEFHLTHL